MIKLKKDSFTLIEVLIVALVLALILAIGTGFFVSLVRIQKYNLRNQEISSQISYALEKMNRMIRMAEKDYDGSCLGAGNENKTYINPGGNRNGIKFINYQGECQEFYLDSGIIYSRVNSGTPFAMSSGNFYTQVLEFFILGDNISSDRQPRVTILMKMTSITAISEERPSIKIQTTVSKRNLSI